MLDPWWKKRVLGKEAIYAVTYKKNMNKIINTESGINNNENEDINDNSDDEIWDYIKQYDTNGKTMTPWSHEA